MPFQTVPKHRKKRDKGYVSRSIANVLSPSKSRKKKCHGVVAAISGFDDAMKEELIKVSDGDRYDYICCFVLLSLHVYFCL